MLLVLFKFRLFVEPNVFGRESGCGSLTGGLNYVRTQRPQGACERHGRIGQALRLTDGLLQFIVNEWYRREHVVAIALHVHATGLVSICSLPNRCVRISSVTDALAYLLLIRWGPSPPCPLGQLRGCGNVVCARTQMWTQQKASTAASHY